jgi:2-polyprenyl-3-methyl-5-hydroxy-6-metoxy-1,4-benzoquinol methylase
MDFKKFYEWYHRERKLPKRVINKKNFTYRIILEVLDKYCSSKKVLDVGSGVGTVDFYLAKKGKQVTGIEISQKAFNIARRSSELFQLNRMVKFKRLDFFKSTFREKYDFVLCSEVLEHLPHDRLALSKIRKVLTNSGIFMLTVPSINAPLTKFGAIEPFDERSGHLRRYTLQSATRLLAETGFRVIFSKKAEGLIRNSLFVFRLDLLVHLANRFSLISDAITFVDNISLKLFGESDLILIAKRK